MYSGDLTFEFSGPKLCFCIELYRLSARNNAPEYCSALDSVGSFEERLEDFREEEAHERVIQREQHFVSEYVKTLRLQSEATNSERYGNLLQELILVEKSQQKMWDSQVFHGHSQRFQRDHYIQALQAELKKEVHDNRRPYLYALPFVDIMFSNITDRKANGRRNQRTEEIIL